MPNPAVLLLGGLSVAWNQRYLDAAHARGLAVLVADAPGPHVAPLLAGWPASRPLAEVAELPPGDVAGIVDRAATWSARYDIRGVCCLREEYVEATAWVADLLALPAPGLRAARVCRNKYLQRRYLAAWSPAAELVGPDRRADAVQEWTRFPLVVKPVGRLASSGVRLVSGSWELRDCFADYGADEVLLFEERLLGQEYSVESLSQSGQLRYTEVTEKRTTEHGSAYFVEMGHTTPAPGLVATDRTALLAAHEAVLARLGFGTGMAHAEYRLTGDGAVRLIEIAVRPPGDSILALHWLATGTPLEDALVGLAVGEPVAIPTARRYARQVYLPHDAGVLDGLTVDPALGVRPLWFSPAEVRAQVAAAGAAGDPPALRCVMALKPAGTPLAPIRESGDRAAMFVLDAATPAELDELEARCRAAITVRVTPDKN
ncbi:MAG TPA: ATP-grasp domain-containing protein [Mycobacteriales bacterium]|nr:ATP-grasp domain-containing protein [Mycobacteriales bacterium]